MIYDLGKLNEYVERGLLRKAEIEDLVQYNYTEKVNNAPRGELWDEITMFNRGNVYEKKTGELIARAMPKFLNFEQHSEEKQAEILNEKNIQVTEKLDGCLGILYTYKDKLFCNSRGSFDNYVTDKIRELVPNYVMVKTLCRHNTLNVEVISPATRIICDYGDTEALNLITAYYRNNHTEYNREDLQILASILRMPMVNIVDMTWDDLIAWQGNADYSKEGFVVKLPNNDRIKIKSKEYLKVAKFKCNLNKLYIYNLIKQSILDNKEYMREYCADIPDEFIQTAEGYAKEIYDELQKHKDACYTEYNKVKDIPTKELYKTDCKYLSGIYAIRNGKPEQLDKIMIKLVNPEG